MKKFFLLAAMLGSVNVVAQYIPNSNQSYQFSSVSNPAFTGIEEFGDFKLGYRYQWTAFGNNAPKFLNMTYNCRLNNPADLTRNSFRTSAPALLPKAKRILHGISANLFNEDVGVVNRWGGGIGYALHYPVSEKNVWIAAGVSLIIDNTRVDVEDIYLGANPDPDPFYDQLVNNGVNQTDLNARVGVVVYAPMFYLGFSYLPLWTKSVEASEVSFSNNFYKATLQAGFTLPFGDDFRFKPSVAGILQEDDQVHLDYAIKTYYMEKMWLGVAYRDIESGVGLVGFSFNKILSVTYSYEVPVNGLQQFSKGSHELVLAVRLQNAEGHNQYIW